MQTQQQYQGAYQEPCLMAGSAVGRQPGVGDGAACRHIHTAQAAAAVHWFMITVPADVHTYLAFVHSNHVSKQAVGISVCARMPHYYTILTVGLVEVVQVYIKGGRPVGVVRVQGDHA